VIALLVAGMGDAQGAFEVIRTVTWLPFARVVVVKVWPVCPTTGFIPIYHW
jgi:hypothetical protein